MTICTLFGFVASIMFAQLIFDFAHQTSAQV